MDLLIIVALVVLAIAGLAFAAGAAIQAASNERQRRAVLALVTAANRVCGAYRQLAALRGQRTTRHWEECRQAIDHLESAAKTALDRCNSSGTAQKPEASR